MAPRLQLLPHCPGAWDQGAEAHPLCHAYAERALPVSLALSPTAAHPHEAERHALLKRHGGLWTVTGRAITPAEAEGQAVPAHAETQEHLVEIITALLAVSIRRTRRDWPCPPGGLLLLHLLQGERRRILGQPGSRESLDRQGLEGERTQAPVQLGRQQPIEALASPVILERGA